MKLTTDHTIEALIIEGIETIKRQNNTKCYSKKLIYELFTTIEKSCELTTTVSKNDTRALQYVDAAMVYINRNLSHQISLEELSNYVNLERTYLSKLFHRYTGMTLQHYIIHLRMEMAQKLLRAGQMSVKEVGACVGIQDPYYFSKLFKKTKGIPPSAYIQ